MPSSLDLPAWLTDDFLQEIVRRTKGDPLAKLCHRCKVSSGVQHGGGQNYSSVLYRTTVHYRSAGREHAIDLMLKSESREVLLTDRTMFGTELRMYGEVLPAMDGLLTKAGEGISVPRLIYSVERPQRMIVMEDLSPTGWATVDEIDSFEEALPTVRALAKFHAASFVLNQGCIDLTRIKNNFVDFAGQFVQLYCNFADEVCTWEGFGHIGSKLQALKPTFLSKLKQIYVPNRGGTSPYNVLNHGDFHAGNLLHKTKNRRIEETALIDFQLCHWGSPAIDLLYLLYLVVSRNVMNNHRDRIIREYHQNFVEFLIGLGHQGWTPSLKDLQSELQKKAFLELFIEAILQQFRTVRLDQVAMEEFVAGRIPGAGINNERYREHIRGNLKQLLRRGALD